MLKRFVDGLVFGSGFSLAFVVLTYTVTFIITPFLTEHQINNIEDSIKENNNDLPVNKLTNNDIQTTSFHDLDVEDKIKQASVIALVRYQKELDGQMKAIIKEFIKIKPGVNIYYNVGDEMATLSYYPKENTDYGDGAIVFFTGSPAMMKLSTTFHGDRIHSLGNMPLDMLRKKCITSQ